MSPRTSTPTQPFTPGEQMDRPIGQGARQAMDRGAADLAMRSDHHAFAGSAQGVGSVDFDDPGAFEVNRPQAQPARRVSADPASRPHSEPKPDAETRRVRAGGLAPGEDRGADADAGARMAERDAFRRPRRPQDAPGSMPRA